MMYHENELLQLHILVMRHQMIYFCFFDQMANFVIGDLEYKISSKLTRKTVDSGANLLQKGWKR